MSLPKRYNPHTAEPDLQTRWQLEGTYAFDPHSKAPVFSIDTPPPTVSGKLHLGHTFSYSHPDFIARFWRMNGHNVFYPLGFDDNGLPTGRLVEQSLGQRAIEIGRQDFNSKCLQISAEVEGEYKQLLQRLGLSIDWDYTYRTIDDDSRRIAQLSFLELYRQGLVYRKESPAIWCPECGTAIAQADLDDIQRQSEFVTLKFPLPSGRKINGRGYLPIATTRPELLPSCVAIFVHPEDPRYTAFIGSQAEVPLFKQPVPVLADPLADPQKGTGVVMCCTFGDQTDVTWWRQYDLPLLEALDREGRMTAIAGPFQGLPIREARNKIKETLFAGQDILSTDPISQSVRVHERCDTPVEYISTAQWFIRILDFKQELLAAGEKVNWHPAHMESRYRAWVQNLNWDWCISRQRYYGVPFPVWYCRACGKPLMAEDHQLPVDPLEDHPLTPCPACGGTAFSPEMDVLDTWATSSLSPQIVGQWLANPRLYQMVFPFSLRSQAHEIIRTWAFYTIAKSKFHFDQLPWRDALISGWGIAAEGMGKISKSRGGGPLPPLEMINRYSADALRYWAASTAPGKDALISEEKIQMGAKLVNKIWHVARFSSRFITTFNPQSEPILSPDLTPADRWALSKTQALIHRITTLYRNYDYAAAKAETETFFWQFADNYIEMVKQRLYDPASPLHRGAQYTLFQVVLTLLKLFAPILPHVTESIYQGLLIEPGLQAESSQSSSIHKSPWPVPDQAWIDGPAETFGDILMDITTQVRRYKSEHNLSLGTELSRVQLATGDPDLAASLHRAVPDLMSITRALKIEVQDQLNPALDPIFIPPGIFLGIDP